LSQTNIEQYLGDFAIPHSLPHCGKPVRAHESVAVVEYRQHLLVKSNMRGKGKPGY